MAIPIDSERLHDLIQCRFGSVDGLVAAWAVRSEDAQETPSRARDRATVYGWLKRGRIPAQSHALFGLASLLDVDPLTFLPLNETFISGLFKRERANLQKALRAGRISAPFRDIVEPGARWPNDETLRAFFERGWSAHEFAHDPARIANVYAHVRLSPVEEAVHVLPRVYYFAYRRTGAPDGIWRPYGAVVRLEERTCLISESGHFQERPAGPADVSASAETYFGPGPAEFRVASIHAFTCDVTAPSDDPGIVRFAA